jgi:hypothetical protein
MYIVCNLKLPRPTSRPRERRNIKTRSVREIKILLTMLAREKWRRGR